MKRKKIWRLLKTAIVSTIIAIGGWAAFVGFLAMSNLEQSSPMALIVIGLAIMVIGGYLGVKG